MSERKTRAVRPTVMRLPLLALTAVLTATACTDDVPVSPPVPPPSISADVTPAASPPPGSRVEPTPYTVPTSPATVPLTEMTRQPDAAALPTHHRSLDWQLIRLYDGGKTLAIRYAPGCEEDRGTVQLEQTPEYVLVRVVHPEGTNPRLCLRTFQHKVTLDAPLAGRSLLHAPTR